MAQLARTPSFAFSSASSGLNELDVIVPTTDTYIVKCSLTLPTVVQGNGQSGVVTTIKVNSSTVYTSALGSLGFVTEIPCLAGNTIRVITASSNANDNAINAVRIQVAISQGGSL